MLKHWDLCGHLQAGPLLIVTAVDKMACLKKVCLQTRRFVALC